MSKVKDTEVDFVVNEMENCSVEDGEGSRVSHTTELENLLISWGMHNLYQQFKYAQILEVELLKLLTDGDIQALFPQEVTYRRVRAKIVEWRKANGFPVHVQTLSEVISPFEDSNTSLTSSLSSAHGSESCNGL